MDSDAGWEDDEPTVAERWELLAGETLPPAERGWAFNDEVIVAALRRLDPAAQPTYEDLPPVLLAHAS